MEPVDQENVIQATLPLEVKSAPAVPFLNRGDIVRDRYQVLDKIGQGAFGEIYAGLDIKPPGEDVAIKCELIDNKKMVLRLEVIALKCLQSCSHVVRYITSGRHNDTINYLVMERLGKNLSDFRKETPQGEFDFSTSVKLALNMLEGIEGVHELGYIHRDIKPSNFVMGKGENSRRCYLIDFGLARKYRTDTGEIRPPRVKAGFRGTTRYASIASHQGKELGRVDDLWSLFYLLVELVLRELPWRRKKEKNDIMAIKEANLPRLVDPLPEEFRLFQNHLQSLAYEDVPNYSYLKALLQSMLEKRPFPLTLELTNGHSGGRTLPAGMDSARGNTASLNNSRSKRKKDTEVIKLDAGVVGEISDDADVGDGAAELLHATPFTKPSLERPQPRPTPRLSSAPPPPLGGVPNFFPAQTSSDEPHVTTAHSRIASFGVVGREARDSVLPQLQPAVLKTEKKNGCKCVVS